MEPIPRNARLVRRAYWLIRIRWIAIIGVILATFVAGRVLVLQVSVNQIALYCVAAVLTVYNSVFLILLNRAVKPNGERVFSAVHRIVSVQISLDLILLTVLLHFSGGVENPFMIYFVFHMVIASILLPAWESYLQAALAVCLVVLLVLLEHQGIIHHYCLKGLLPDCIMGDRRLIVVMVTVFTTTLFMIIYMTSSISTQLRDQEEAYWQANIQLKEKDKVKDEYVSRVTHDIKGHLAAIQSCLEVVVNRTLGPLNERQSDFVGRAQKRTATLANFVRTLLRLTQMRLSDKLEVHEFSLTETIADAVSSVESRAQNKSIVLTTAVGPSVDKIVGNKFSIEEVIVNVLLNAIKYTPEKGAVEISAVDKGDCVQIEVKDTGIGIPADEIPRVFDEFFRGAKAKKTERDGTGLGLSIAKQIVERHNGSIWVESTQGEGSIFKLTLPITGRHC
ncbi:MAG: HAMP domain-containing histidine kinase [Planctomycetes bacterium]|nr:HAMP domain-containing histidine kinase [Planctomycetota bacterium]